MYNKIGYLLVLLDLKVSQSFIRIKRMFLYQKLPKNEYYILGYFLKHKFRAKTPKMFSQLRL